MRNPRRPDWERRFAAIQAILVHGAIRSQGELQKKLARRGFPVTQSSVSRDLAELKAAKVEGRYVLGTSLAEQDAMPELARVAGMLRGVKPAGPNLLVVRTVTGSAPQVALAIDLAGWPDIVGTLAGDDTLFVATTGRRDQARVEARLQRSLRPIEKRPRPV